MLYNVLLIIQIVISVGIIVLVLMQQGKGADAGAAFGCGASGTVFGSRGSANFLSRTTAILATVFFLNSMTLAFLASGRTIESGSIMGGAALPAETTVETAPAEPAGDVPPAPDGGNTVKSDVPPPPATDAAVQPDERQAVEAEKAVEAQPADAVPAVEEKSVQEKKD